MQALLSFSRGVDWMTERIGRSVYWLLLAAVIISTVNAIVRKAFNVSSNAYLEAQWYLFAAVFMLGAGYVFLHDQHVRIDVVSSKLSRRAQVWIDVLGIIIPAAKQKAELARIGRYYATESMLVWNPETQRYDAAATPSAGPDSLHDYYRQLLDGTATLQPSEHSVF